ncbi:M23 family metallopeptidase [Nocardioides alkalitolerans]|uniref:M23 family metallopeptidase n=1 Tax=Nocardioides alkalitolerans TaxID=281714 RepID=UPI000400AE10|nr:M23 family metallopeptidase [Nocardioides alkalitolerans]
MGNHRADHRGQRRGGSDPATPDVPRTTPGKRAARPEPRRRASAPEAAAPAEVLTRETQVREPVAAPRDRGQEMRFEDTTQSIPVVTEHDVLPTTYDVRGFAAEDRAARTAARSAAQAGRRRAVKEPRSTPTASGLFRPLLPSAPVLAGVAVLAISTGGAVTAAGSGPLAPEVSSSTVQLSASNGMSGTSTSSRSDLLADRNRAISRDSERDALEDAADEDAAIVEAEAAAERRSTAIETLGNAAEAEAARLAENRWVLPVDSYRITNVFGQAESYYSSGYHTGLDFAAPSGTTIRAVAGGTVTESGYDGSYGNKTVITLEDGTEMWYAHQSSVAVEVGQTVASGDVIGYVGSTGNSSGPHLHLEVRPGAGDPVDPRSALINNGVTP